jgi:hypothetical protein
MKIRPQPSPGLSPTRGQADNGPQGCGSPKPSPTWENADSSTIHTPYYDYYINISKNQKK